MNKQQLTEIIVEQAAQPLPVTIVRRWQYQELLSLVHTKEIIIVSGIRRSGKSTLLNILRNNHATSNYYINFDDDRLVNFKVDDFSLLLEVFINLYGVQDIFYFDEIQNIIGWERFVRRLHNAGKKVFITGSNAKLLSNELGTHLTGRYIPVELFPYSFAEFFSLRDSELLQKINTNKLLLTATDKALGKKYFAEFKQLGGMPEYLENKQIQYLQTLYENILYKDIIIRNNLTQAKPIEELVYYLASNNAKEFSFNALRSLIGVSSANTVANYCKYLEDSFLCFMLSRFSYSVKKQVHYAKKIYFIDQALALSVGFRFSEDHGRTLENIVFLELMRRYSNIYFHQEKYECDFVIRDGYNIVAAIQVAVTLEQPSTKLREINGLLEALYCYNLTEGLIITEDESGIETRNYKGNQYKIKIVSCYEWLLG